LAHCPAYANLGALIVRLAQQTAQITALCNSGQLDDLRALVPGLLHIREEFLLELHALQMEVAVR
jgi:hypothetical protein